MSLALRKWLAVFFALWLPFSAVAAAMMPACLHDQAKQIHSASVAEHGGEQHEGCPDQVPADEGVAAGDCGQCGLCLFACTPWLLGTQSSLEAISSFAAIGGVFPSLHSLVLPPADRPPLSAA